MVFDVDAAEADESFDDDGGCAGLGRAGNNDIGAAENVEGFVLDGDARWHGDVDAAKHAEHLDFADVVFKGGVGEVNVDAAKGGEGGDVAAGPELAFAGAAAENSNHSVCGEVLVAAVNGPRAVGGGRWGRGRRQGVEGEVVGERSEIAEGFGLHR